MCQEWNYYYWDDTYSQCVKCLTGSNAQRWQSGPSATATVYTGTNAVTTQCCEIYSMFNKLNSFKPSKNIFILLIKTRIMVHHVVHHLHIIYATMDMIHHKSIITICKMHQHQLITNMRAFIVLVRMAFVYAILLSTIIIVQRLAR